MSGKAIPMGKSRTVEDPWLVITLGDALGDGWEYRVLKAYTEDPDSPRARWHCAVKSPYTFGGFDQGDTYIADIKGFAGPRPVITQRDPSVPDEALPAWLRS
jgi:hypothetical protein